jgi:hypothetical protein
VAQIDSARKRASQFSLALCNMTKIQITISIAILLIAINGLASNSEVNINGAAPEGMEHLATNVNSHEGTPENRGHHGLVEYCYRAESFVVYSKNLLGHGYQLSSAHPKKLECIAATIQLTSSNKLGMFIGMPKKSVGKIVGVENLQDKQTIIWLSDTVINGVVFDVQTYTEMRFKDNKLEWISVFTTTTH